MYIISQKKRRFQKGFYIDQVITNSVNLIENYKLNLLSNRNKLKDIVKNEIAPILNQTRLQSGVQNT